MKARGELTVWIANKISDEWKKRGYDVLYDHGSKHDNGNVGKIVSWFGEKYNREAELSQLDIAIVKKNSNDVFALIEIEESTDRPKTLLGDIFGMLMGEHVMFGGKRELTLDKNAVLVILGYSKVRHDERNRYIQDKAMKVKSDLHTANANVKKIIVDTFADEEELSAVMASVLDRAFKGEM